MDIIFGLLVFLAVLVSATFLLASGQERRRHLKALITSEGMVLLNKPQKLSQGYLAKLETRSRLAGYKLSGIELFGTQVLCAALLFGVGITLFSKLLVACLVSLLGLYLPGKYIDFKIHQRSSRMLDQLAKLLPMVANYLRAGYSLQQSIISGTVKTPEPLKEIFAQVKKDIDASVPVVRALESAAEGVPLTEFQLVVLATKINNQIGGNLADIYDTIAKTISERQEIVEQQKAYTTQAKLNSTIVGLMAVALLIIFRFISPDYFSPLLQSFAGQLVFAGCWASIVLGWFAVRRISQPKF